MTCQSCRVQSSSGRFCISCGSTLVPESSSLTQTQSPIVVVDASGLDDFVRIAAKWFFLVLIVVAVLITSFLFLSSESPANPSLRSKPQETNLRADSNQSVCGDDGVESNEAVTGGGEGVICVPRDKTKTTLRDFEKEIVAAMHAPEPAYIPVPEDYWQQMEEHGTTSIAVRRATTAVAMQLNELGPPAIVISGNPNADDPEMFCGSAGCPFEIVEKRGARYFTLLSQDVGGGVTSLKEYTNGYRDVFTAGGSFVTIYRYDGKSYRASACFTKTDNALLPETTCH
ncbi:MAG: hypothetical protein JWO13_1664 [Acidobacteriales bacterium]|nr:hypothetical protein [Terriglobales bacterium]